MKKELINKLFSNMCCSDCRSDFTEESLKIIRQENDLYVVQITCQKCGKSFGLALFGHCSLKKNFCTKDDDLVLQIQEGPAPIGIDDVLDAHNFIKNLEDDWQKYIPESLKKQTKEA